MEISTSIPVSLCEYVLTHRKINQFKVYLHLKLHSNGYVNSDISMQKLGEETGINPKTAKRCLEWLIKNKWVTINGKKEVYHIIGYKELAKKLGIKIVSGYLCEINNYKDMKALFCAVVVTQYLNRKRYFDKRQSGCIKGRPITNCKRNKYYPMPNSYLAKSIGVSVTTAYRYIQEAEKAGYIETKSNYRVLETEQGDKIKLENYHVILTGILNEGRPNRLKKKKNYLAWEEPTLIRSYIGFKKKGYSNRK